MPPSVKCPTNFNWSVLWSGQSALGYCRGRHNSRAFLARLAARGFPWDRFRRLTHLAFRAVKMARHGLRRIFSQRTPTGLDVSLLFRRAALAAGSSSKNGCSNITQNLSAGIAGPGRLSWREIFRSHPRGNPIDTENSIRGGGLNGTDGGAILRLDHYTDRPQIDRATRHE